MGRFSRCSQGYSHDRRISWNLHHNVSTYWKYGDQLHFEQVAYTLGHWHRLSYSLLSESRAIR